MSAAACGGSSGDVCTTDDECPSHFCKADGTCGPAPVDGAVQQQDATDASTALCNANHDGQITLPEVPLAAGKTATFRIATNASWDTAGQANTDGSRRWDLSTHLGNDADQTVTLLGPAGQWWATDFPSASYATQLVSTSDLLGVFQLDASGLVLLGVVSPEAGVTQTNLSYDPPAKILALPFGAGTTWSSTSTVSGHAQGVSTAYTEKYQSRADQVGSMKTPYGDFPVLRVTTDLTRTSGFATILTNRTFAWVAECFGSVAVATSKDFATGSEVTSEAEIRRLAP